MSRICESENGGLCNWTAFARERGYACTKRKPIGHCMFLKGYSERLERMNKWRIARGLSEIPHSPTLADIQAITNTNAPPESGMGEGQEREGGVKNCPKCNLASFVMPMTDDNRYVCANCGHIDYIEGDGVTYDGGDC